MAPSLFQIVFFLVLAYLSGSVPFGRMIAGAVARVDITQRGSGNIGATNVAREVGLVWGALTLFLDFLKGALPVGAWAAFFPYQGPWEGPGVASAVALSAILGHQFSLFLRFRGGKGVATAMGGFLMLAPGPSLLSLLVFVLVVCWRGIVSLGSLSGALALPLFMVLVGEGLPVVAAGILASGLIVLSHRDNLRRLRLGEEIPLRTPRNQDKTSKRRSSSSSEKK